MSNYLPKEMIEQMQALRKNGASLREVARRLGIDRKTARRYFVGAQKDREQQARERRIWLSKERYLGSRLPQDEWYGAIGEIACATAKIKSRDLREDVSQEMIAASLEGRLPRVDIWRAVKTFIYHFMFSLEDEKRDARVFQNCFDIPERAYNVRSGEYEDV